jgi:hypothetical protein
VKGTPGHGKELMASHELPPHAPLPRTWKPLAAGLLMLIIACGGFFFSGLYLAAPQSPWVTGDTGDIFGHVKDRDGHSIANATVSVGDRENITNATGWFHINPVKTGRQAIVVEAPGFRQLRWVTIISGGNPLEYSFVLTAGNGTETHDDVGNLSGGFYSCGSLLVVFTAMTLLGSLLAFQRRSYPLATAGAILSFSVGYFQVIVYSGFVLPIGIILSLVSVILLLFSRGEFS